MCKLMRAGLALSVVLLPVWGQSSLSGIPSATERMRSAAVHVNVPFPLVQPEIHVYKATHRLELWASGKKIKSYEIALGSSGMGAKRRNGDHLTPEGRFYICSRNARSQFHLFLGLSYPDEAAAERGFASGLISKDERAAILAANKRHVCPAWNTRLGGTVGVHGGGVGLDWTWGCIALRDAEIDELWVACPNGTAVLIEL